jgi:four helix bundle protein
VAGFRELVVWQRAIQNSVAVYKLTSQFPSQEVYGLTSQLRRASVSVASNIAEGYGRTSRGEFRHFLGMARGSNCEVATQLVIAEELDFGDQLKLDASAELSVEVGKMLNAMIKRLESPAAGVVKSPIPVP